MYVITKSTPTSGNFFLSADIRGASYWTTYETSASLFGTEESALATARFVAEIEHLKPNEKETMYVRKRVYEAVRII